MGNRRWEMGNGKWEMGNGKWKMGNGKWKMENEQWEIGNGQWEMGNGKWEMGNGQLLYGPAGTMENRQWAIGNGQLLYGSRWTMGNFFMVQVGNGQMETMDTWQQPFTEAKIILNLNFSRWSLYTTGSSYGAMAYGSMVPMDANYSFSMYSFPDFDTTNN